MVTDDGVIDDSGLVNSQMYKREARHFSSKKLFSAASHKLALGESPPPQSVSDSSCSAHAMSPTDTDILASLSQSLLSSGQHEEALRLVRSVRQELRFSLQVC